MGSEQELEEITITAPDGSSRLVITDRTTGKQHDIRQLVKQGVIDQSVYDQYCTNSITLSQFADIVSHKTKVTSSVTRKSEQDLEEITVTAPDGSSHIVINDAKSGEQYDIKQLLEQGVIDQSVYDQYRNRRITLTQFADIITSKTKVTSTSSVKRTSEQELEEITVTAPDGSSHIVISDGRTGNQYDIQQLLEQGVIDQAVYDQYRTRRITTAQFVEIITRKTKVTSTSSSVTRTSGQEMEEITVTDPDGSS